MSRRKKQQKGINVFCPFYHKHEGCHLYCDGTTNAALSTQLNFKDGADRGAHMKIYCETLQYRACALARALEEANIEP